MSEINLKANFSILFRGKPLQYILSELYSSARSGGGGDTTRFLCLSLPPHSKQRISLQHTVHIQKSTWFKAHKEICVACYRPKLTLVPPTTRLPYTCGPLSFQSSQKHDDVTCLCLLKGEPIQAHRNSAIYVSSGTRKQQSHFSTQISS